MPLLCDKRKAQTFVQLLRSTIISLKENPSPRLPSYNLVPSMLGLQAHGQINQQNPVESQIVEAQTSPWRQVVGSKVFLKWTCLLMGTILMGVL